MGADGGIGGTYGVMPELYLKMDECIRSGNISLAQKIQYTCDRIIYAMCGCHGNLYAVMKEIMRRREGLELGGVRPPLPGLAAGDSPKVDQCARMIDEAIETYCK